MKTLKSHSRSILWHTVLVFAIIVLLFPLIWAVSTSIKPISDQYSPVLIPQRATLENYFYVLSEYPLISQLKNTFIMALGIGVGQVVVAGLASFGIIYFKPRWSKLLYGLVALTLLIPAQTLIIPQFLLTSELNWLNTSQGLIVPQIANFAVSLLLLHRAINDLSPTQIESARLDGAGAVSTFIYVVLPQMRASLGAVFILGFISGWNEYLWPLLIASQPEDTVVQIGLQQFMSEGGNNYGGLLAAAVISLIPILIIYAFASRQITSAFMLAHKE